MTARVPLFIFCRRSTRGSIDQLQRDEIQRCENHTTAHLNVGSRRRAITVSRRLAAFRVDVSMLGKAAAEAVGSDFSATAINYFSSIRIPASLLAGSSLAALFSITDKAKDAEARNRTRIEAIVLIIYHLWAVSSFLLSLNVIVTATATTTAIMFGGKNPIATTAFELMKREFEFEFLMCRWSFFASLFTFLGSVAARALLQFELLHKKRLTSALLVISSFGGLFFHLLAFVNARLFCYNNYGEMTWAVFAMWFQRSIAGRGPCELASLLCSVFAVATACALFARSGKFAGAGYSAESTDGDEKIKTT